MIVVWLFLAVPWVCLQFVIVVFSDQLTYRFVLLLLVVHTVNLKLIKDYINVRLNASSSLCTTTELSRLIILSPHFFYKMLRKLLSGIVFDKYHYKDVYRWFVYKTSY